MGLNLKLRCVFAVLALAAAMQGCRLTTSDIELVKKGVMELDKTLTVGEAFDGWAQCSQKKWEAFETANGRKVVEFSCAALGVPELVTRGVVAGDYGTPSNPGMPNYLNLAEAVYVFQWGINKDDTFILLYGGSTWRWKDGTVSEQAEDDSVLLVRAVYNNESALAASVDSFTNQVLAAIPSAYTGFYKGRQSREDFERAALKKRYNKAK